MIHPNAEGGKQLHALVKKELLGYLNYSNDVLPLYIVAMVAKGYSQAAVARDLNDFLGPDEASRFSEWLFKHLEDNPGKYESPVQAQRAAKRTRENAADLEGRRKRRREQGGPGALIEGNENQNPDAGDQGGGPQHPEIKKEHGSGVAVGTGHASLGPAGSVPLGDLPAAQSSAHFPIQCEVCGVQINSLKSWEEHQKGKKHRLWKEVSAGPGGVCKLCSVHCTSAEAWRLHLAGRKHRKKLAKLDSEAASGGAEAASNAVKTGPE